MTERQLEQRITSELQAEAKPDFAATIHRFFREPVSAYGVPSPRMKEVARSVYREVKGWPPERRDRLFEALWKSGNLEKGAIVCHVYRRFAKQCAEREFALFEAWLDRHVKNWSHADGVAAWLVAASIANRPKLIAKLARWTKSKNRWKRRAAAVSLVDEAKRGRNTESIFRICDLLRDDPDDMVQKGVGWLLKETYPRKPREVVRFLEPWKTTAPRLVLRYAAEKMTTQDRKQLLGS